MKTIIKPVYTKPDCRQCKWYVRQNISDALNGCSKFKWYLKNEVHYEYAENCRKKEEMCGEWGYYFKEKLNEK
jgi:hypothetical protein